MVAEPKLEIYLDGSCAFCQWSRAHIEPWDTRERLLFLDYNDPQLAEQAPFTRQELASEMHLKEPNGTWTAGFAAWVRILRVLPRLAWLGRILGAPPLRWLGPSVYGWVARHRQLLPGVPQACTPASCAPKASAPGRRAS